MLRVDFLTSGMQLVSSGSDGLLKIWTIKTNECDTTLDNHTEKVWALAVRKDQKYIASGGADSVVNFWEDITREEQEEELREKEQYIIKYVYMTWKYTSLANFRKTGSKSCRISCEIRTT